MTRQDIKKLERKIMKYLTTKRGGKHYETFELMYNMMEHHKMLRHTLRQLSEELYRDPL